VKYFFPLGRLEAPFSFIRFHCVHVQSSGTGYARPDFIITASGLSAAFAECKRHGTAIDVAWQDIINKCSDGFPQLFYQSVPYLPLFVATGDILQFGILWQSGKVVCLERASNSSAYASNFATICRLILWILR
jgi:hypothetical protein